MRLKSPPTGPVTVSITGDAQVTSFPRTMVFDSSNWDVSQLVTVTAIDDPMVERPHTGTLKHSAKSSDPAYNGLSIVSVIADILDNDSPLRVREPTGPTVVTEDGLADLYTVVLLVRPTGPVTFSIAPDKQVKTNKKKLIFTTNNWMVPQTILVWANNDKKQEKLMHWGVIRNKTQSADVLYNGIPTPFIKVAVIDNDGKNKGKTRAAIRQALQVAQQAQRAKLGFARATAASIKDWKPLWAPGTKHVDRLTTALFGAPSLANPTPWYFPAPDSTQTITASTAGTTVS